MQIYISKNNQQLGPFEEAKVLEMLQSGQLSPNDPAVPRGGNQWQPLSVLLPTFNFIGTPFAGFNVPPTAFEASKKVRSKGLSVFILVLGILVFLGGAAFTVNRHTGFSNMACKEAERLLTETRQAREEFEFNKTEENLKKFESKRSSGRSWAVSCDTSTSAHRFWMASGIITAIVGLIITIVGFF